MKYTGKYRLYGTLEEVLESAKRRSDSARVHPNIKSLKQLKWEESDTEIHCEFIARGDAEIPDPVRRLISPRMLSWREIGRWDKVRNIYEYFVRTYHFSKYFHMSGRFQFTEHSERLVVCDLEGDICVDIPVFSSLIERTVVRYQLDNIRREIEIFNNGMQAVNQAEAC